MMATFSAIILVLVAIFFGAVSSTCADKKKNDIAAFAATIAIIAGVSAVFLARWG